MPYYFSFLLSLTLLSAAAQQPHKEEHRLKLDRKCWIKKHAYADPIAIDSIDYGFLALSAYTLDTVTDFELEYRYRQESSWGEWQAFPQPAHGEATDRQTRAAPPIFESASAIQLRSSDSLKDALILRLFFAPPEKKSPDASTLAPAPFSESCNCPAPPICQRNCWCPDSTCPPPSSYSTTEVSHLIVHHSAGFTHYHDYPWVVAYYWDLHVNTNGWDDIGYNWLIDPNGVVYEGRGSGNSGAHFSCMNGNTSGICIIGDYRQNSVSHAALQSLTELSAWESCQHEVNPDSTSLHAPSQLQLRHISGHRDGNASSNGCPSGTVCPGAQLYQQLDSLAAATANKPCLLSVEDLETAAPQLSPNPFRENLNLQFAQEGPHLLKLMDSRGKVLRRTTIYGSVGRWELSGLPAGSYILKSGNSSQKIIKL